VTTTPSEGQAPTARDTPELRAQRTLSPLIQKLAGVIDRLDIRRGKKVAKRAAREFKSNAKGNTEFVRQLGRLDGVNPQALAQTAMQSVAAETAARAQAAGIGRPQGGPSGQPLDTQSAVDLMREGQLHPGASAPDGHSTGQGGAAVSPIEKGKGKDGIGK
jgi:hypothetical protein